MRFPTKKADIYLLANEMIAGFANNTGVYPTPPVTVQQLAARLGASQTSNQQSIAAHNVAKQATATDKEDLGLLVTDMKKNISYAENTVGNDALKLQLIGWDADDGDTPLAVPGQPRYFEAVHQGEGTIGFDWKAADDGGKAVSYCIERRERPTGDWVIAGVSTTKEATVINQPRGKELEYRVCGLNPAGQGEVSNLVVAVL